MKLDRNEKLVNYYSPMLFDSKFKGVVQVFHDHLKTQAINTTGKFLDRIFKTRWNGDYYAMSFFGPSQKMKTVLQANIDLLVSGGFINYYEKDYNEYLKPKRYEHLHPVGPKVLTMSDLQAGFVIWLCSVMMAVIAFIGELVWNRVFINSQRIQLH